MSNSTKQWLLPGLVLAVGLVVVAVVGFISLRNTRDSAAEDSAHVVGATPVTNQDVDPGTSAGDIPAPNFELVDQAGRETSLAQFRGKVVLIAFVDSRCTTICPLTTESMVEALRLLGPAAADVQLLGINANPLALKVSDVAAYTDAHDMQGKWRFLTGTLPQLKKVWRDYHVYVAAINNDIDHQPAMVLVDSVGREHKIYMTQMSYEGVAPQSQVLADDMAALLPGPPTAAQEVSMKYVQPLEPSTDATLPAIGNRKETVAMGGDHAHLMLFFASWLDQDSNLPFELKGLDEYAAVAQRKNWPAPVAVDELATESSPATARAALLQLAGGIRTPIVEDTNGRLGDGYQVEDLPWYSLSSPDGTIIWSHDGWLAPAAIEQQIGAALTKNEEREHTAALTAVHGSSLKPKSAAVEQ